MNYASRPQTFPCWCCLYTGGQCRLHRTARRWRSRTARYSRRGSCGRWRRSTRAKPRLRNVRREQECSLGGALGGEYRHRVRIVDLVFLEADRYPEPVIRSGCFEHLNDFEVVTGIGKRPGEEAPYLASELVGGHLRLRKANRAEQPLEFGQGQVARVRGVAQFFQSVELGCLCRILQCTSVHDDDASLRRAY